MTSRQFRIGGLVLSAAFAALGIWALAEAKYGTGTFWLVMSVAWLLLASFRDKFGFLPIQRGDAARSRSPACYEHPLPEALKARQTVRPALDHLHLVDHPLGVAV